jgi:hypothetical protein
MHRSLARFYIHEGQEVIWGDPIIQYHLYFRVFLLYFGDVNE